MKFLSKVTQIIKGKVFVAFQVYLKSGESIVFTKIVPWDKEKEEYINEIVEMLSNAKENKETINISTDVRSVHKGIITEYKTNILIDCEDISVAGGNIVGNI